MVKTTEQIVREEFWNVVGNVFPNELKKKWIPLEQHQAEIKRLEHNRKQESERKSNLIRHKTQIIKELEKDGGKKDE